MRWTHSTDSGTKPRSDASRRRRPATRRPRGSRNRPRPLKGSASVRQRKPTPQRSGHGSTSAAADRRQDRRATRGKLRRDNARETEEISAAEQDKATQDERNRIVRNHLEDLRSRVSKSLRQPFPRWPPGGCDPAPREQRWASWRAAQRALSSARDDERLRAGLLAAELECAGSPQQPRPTRRYCPNF